MLSRMARASAERVKSSFAMIASQLIIVKVTWPPKIARLNRACAVYATCRCDGEDAPTCSDPAWHVTCGPPREAIRDRIPCCLGAACIGGGRLRQCQPGPLRAAARGLRRRVPQP